MGRRRSYHRDRPATEAERKAASRHKQALDHLSQIPQEHGEGYSVYQGDALALVPLLQAVDHCITDPPYEQETHSAMRRTLVRQEARMVYTPLAFAPLTARQRRFLCRLQVRWLLAFCQVEAVGRYQDLLQHKYKRPLVWRKRDGAPQYTGDRPGMGYESIVCAWCAPGRPHWNGGGKHGWYDDDGLQGADPIYDYPVRGGANHGDARVHATQKPVPLLAAFVRDFTQPGEVVLDPFMGSGTTGVACLQEGRRFVGIEQDPDTFAKACARLQAAARQGQLFPPAAPRIPQAVLL
jgi:site-specific DNA-methyltransferase (adenine-specific)